MDKLPLLYVLLHMNGDDNVCVDFQPCAEGVDLDEEVFNLRLEGSVRRVTMTLLKLSVELREAAVFKFERCTTKNDDGTTYYMIDVKDPAE